MNTSDDLALIGSGSSLFVVIHVFAIFCMLIGMTCSIMVLVASFVHNRGQNFFLWRKPDRIIIYMAICDILYNCCHLADHLQTLITRQHVLPQRLCSFYGFSIFVLNMVQGFLIQVVAINGFAVIVFKKNLDFGPKDAKLLAWSLGVPFVIGMIVAALGLYGPNGAFCFFGGSTAKIYNLFLTTVPVCLIFAINSILYIIIFLKIRKETHDLKQRLGETHTILQASKRAARNMFLFVGAFCTQYWPASVYGIWCLLDDVPLAIFMCLMFFGNIGGVLNGIVYIIIRRGKGTVRDIAEEKTNNFQKPITLDKDRIEKTTWKIRFVSSKDDHEFVTQIDVDRTVSIPCVSQSCGGKSTSSNVKKTSCQTKCVFTIQSDLGEDTNKF